MTEEKAIQGGKHIAAVMKEEGVEYWFGLIGGHLWPISVGMGLAGIKMVHFRHEQGGGYAADAYARASGKVGVCFGTAGPGMTNTVSAIAQAHFCKSPVVAIYGQHYTPEDGRGALQESFAEPVLQSLTKYTRRVVNPALFKYWTKRAFRDAMTYPQGPVALEFPADIQGIRTKPSQQMGYIPNSYKTPAGAAADPASIEKAVKLLMAANKPVIAGGEAIFWSNASDELNEFVELLQIPVITRRVGRGAVPEDTKLAFGGRVRGKILRAADVACTIGLNLGYLEGYGAWAAKAKLIQITESREDIEFTAPSEMVIIASPKAALRQMIDCAKDIMGSYKAKDAWLKEVADLKAAEKKRLDGVIEEVKANKPMHPAWVAQCVVDVLDKDSTIILDGFTSSSYLTSRIVAKHVGAVLDSGSWAGVGHGVGMAVGASVARPGTQVLAMMGDGGFGLGGFDVETAVRVGSTPVYLVNNNAAWMAAVGPLYKKANPQLGTQDPWTPWFMMPTNYAKMFAEVGAYTERVEEPADLKPALERAFKSGKAAVLDVVTDRTTKHTMMASRPPGAPPWMDPEDVPDAMRAQLFPEKK